MTLLELAEALTGLMAADVLTEQEAVAVMREQFDLTSFGAAAVLQVLR